MLRRAWPSSSENPPASFVLVPEEHLTHVATWAGELLPDLVRADMVYFETANGGAVFSTGSITFCVSPSYNQYEQQRLLGRRKCVTPFQVIGAEGRCEFSQATLTRAAVSKPTAD